MIDQFCSAVWQLYHHGRSSLVCVLCLTVGIGVVSSTASLVDRALLRPLPFHQADRLVMIRSQNPADSRWNEQVSRVDFWEWQNECQSLGMTAFELSRLDLPFEGGFQRVYGLRVSPDFFAVLQIKPHLGVDFRDYVASGNWKQVMLSPAVWRTRYHGDPKIVGEVINVYSWAVWPGPGSLSFGLCGLLPEGLRFLPSSSQMVDDRGFGPDRALDFVTPLNLHRGDFQYRGWRDVDALGRLKPGVTLEEAQAEMELICARQATSYPQTNEGWSVRLVPLDEYVFGSIRPFVLAASLAALLVFAIATINVIHLLLVQFHRRQGEMAIRSAMGATPWILWRQVMLEFSLMLAMSVVCGLWTGNLVTAVLLEMAPQQLRWLPITLSLRAVLFGGALAALAGIGVWWLALRDVFTPNLAPLLGAHGSTSSGDQRSVTKLTRMTLLQLLASYTLVLASALLWSKMRQLNQIDPGFEAENRLSMVISLPAGKFDWNYNSVFNHAVVNRVRNLPGVANAAVILGLPMGNSQLGGELTIEGRPLIRRLDLPPVYIRVVTDDYFETMGIPLIQGRKFNASDSIGEVGWTRTAIISQSMVQRCWPGGDPIGRRFKPFPGGRWMEVVGVVGDVHGGGLERGPSIEIYYPEKLFPQSSPTLVVHTRSNPMNSAADIRGAIRDVDPDAIVTDMRTMETVLRDSQAERHFGLRLLSSLAVMGCLLAGFGVVTATDHALATRSQELRIRMACGATPWNILTLVLQQHMKVVVLAMLGGMLGALMISSWAQLPWQDLRFFRVLALLIVPGMLAAAAFIASLLAASRSAFAR